MRPGDTQVTGVTKPPDLRTLRHSGGRPVRRGPIMAFIGTMFRGPLWWASNHRAHGPAATHRSSRRTPRKPTDVRFRGRAPTLVGSRSHEAGFT